MILRKKTYEINQLFIQIHKAASTTDSFAPKRIFGWMLIFRSDMRASTPIAAI